MAGQEVQEVQVAASGAEKEQPRIEDPKELLREYARISIYGWLRSVISQRMKGEIDILASDGTSMWSVEGTTKEIPTKIPKPEMAEMIDDMWVAVDAHLDIFMEQAGPIVEEYSMRIYKRLHEDTGKIVCGMRYDGDKVVSITLED